MASRRALVSRQLLRALSVRLPSPDYRAAMVVATVRFWLDDEGWGVLDSSETTGGCWAHFSVIEMEGDKKLSAGRAVDLEWEIPDGGDFEGWSFTATRVVP